ncbi:MoaD/ThiS family protein [Candidatus Woesearchaeota archaeon]|nr:MoaD/ThiS family protein [Candidatus Woesearchaeota archaeon]
MKITVFLERTKETREIEVSKYEDIFSRLNLNKEAMLIIRNNQLITEKTEIHDNDKITILPVISGG